MQVFHAPIEIAGQMGLLAKGLRALGHQVSAYNTEQNYLGYEQDITNVSADELKSIYTQTKSNYDLFHYHYGLGCTGGEEEWRDLRALGKTVLMHYWGNDVRTEQKAILYNPYARLIGQFLDQEFVHSRLAVQSESIPACIVQDFEMVPYVEPYYQRVYVLPIAIDLAGTIPKYPDRHTRVPLLVHAPTHPYFKGTTYIEETLDRLRQDGYRFRYIKIQGEPHAQVMRMYAQADLIIDQVLCGTYGLFSVEGMALGKPVVAYIREDLKSRFDADLPIVPANPAILYTTLRHLLDQPRSWAAIGIQGRKYVETHHSLTVVVSALEKIYERERLLQSEPGRRQGTEVIQMIGAANLPYTKQKASTGHVRIFLQTPRDVNMTRKKTFKHRPVKRVGHADIGRQRAVRKIQK